MPEPKQRVAIFDMDKTITRKATFGPFIWHVVRKYRPWRALALPLMLCTSLLYALQLIDRSRLKELNLWLLIGPGIKQQALKRIAASFAEETLRTNMLPKALSEIANLRGQGWRIVLATASYRFYVVEIARLLGISEEDVIATENQRAYPEIETQLPWILGQNCYGAEKSDCVEDWRIARELSREQIEMRFYSDHVSDAPCLFRADMAIAANPHAPLRKLAEANGWQIVDWC